MQNVQRQQTNPWSEKVTCTKVNFLSGSGNLKAYATVEIGGALEIHGCRVVQQRGQAAWVSLPQQQKDGKWFNVVYVHDARLKAAISERVLAAWEAQQAVGVRDDDISLAAPF